MKRIVVSILLAALLVIGVSLTAMSAENEGSAALGLPVANIDVGDLVPMDIVKKVALKRAKGKWGQVTAGEPIACSDEDGNISYYMCPFHIGSEPFPDHEQIMKGVKEGRSLRKSVQDGSFDMQLLSTPNSGQTTKQNSSPNLAIPYGVKPAPATSQADYRKALRYARNKETGVGEYGTVYVAATFDRFPIPVVEKALPPYYYNGDIAQQKAKDVLGGTAKLGRIYFLGARGTYFEFLSGSNSVTIDASSLEIKPITKIGRTAPTSDEYQRFKNEWNKASAEPAATGGGTK